jgi:hypothetical protein
MISVNEVILTGGLTRQPEMDPGAVTPRATARLCLEDPGPGGAGVQNAGGLARRRRGACAWLPAVAQAGECHRRTAGECVGSVPVDVWDCTCGTGGRGGSSRVRGWPAAWCAIKSLCRCIGGFMDAPETFPRFPSQQGDWTVQELIRRRLLRCRDCQAACSLPGQCPEDHLSSDSVSKETVSCRTTT